MKRHSSTVIHKYIKYNNEVKLQIENINNAIKHEISLVKRFNKILS